MDVMGHYTLNLVMYPRIHMRQYVSRFRRARPRWGYPHLPFTGYLVPWVPDYRISLRAHGPRLSCGNLVIEGGLCILTGGVHCYILGVGKV